jgi:hypothetical protein
MTRTEVKSKRVILILGISLMTGRFPPGKGIVLFSLTEVHTKGRAGKEGFGEYKKIFQENR